MENDSKTDSATDLDVRRTLESFRRTRRESEPGSRTYATAKALNITDTNQAKANITDIEFAGDKDLFRLLSKAWSEKQGWMKSTKAANMPGAGIVLQVTTQQRAERGDVIAEAVTFVPGVRVARKQGGEGYELVTINSGRPQL